MTRPHVPSTGTPPAWIAFPVIIAVICCCAADLTADQPSPGSEEFFETSIRPVLVEHCLECHSGETEASGNLLLDSRVGWQRGGDLGPAVVPGDVDGSVLIRAMEYGDPALQMPPEGKLDESIIADFRTWVRDGAFDPRKNVPGGVPKKSSGLPVERADEHWAYRTVAPTSIRTVPETGSTPIDGFVTQRLRQAGLRATPPAGRSELIRRLTFDLHGLPPTAEQIDAFVSDPSPLAYEKLVDRLLASPRYGEHFARRWMDVVRYAESITLRGFILPQAWRYRDYLVESFASDRPFDQMVRDQIAGDRLPVNGDIRETQLRCVATGFLAMGNSNLEDQDKTKLEFDYIDEQLETIGRAFLAQTIGCARCHDHKFDPIPTRDYYALAAILRSTTALKHANLSKWIEEPLPLDAEQEARYSDFQTLLTSVESDLKEADAKLKSRTTKKPKMIAVDGLDGVVIDDSQANLVGQWKESDFVGTFVGSGYRHDKTTGRGMKTATFEANDLPPGSYEVRMSYTAHTNRATNVAVTVFSANESKTVTVNQRKQPPINGVWKSLGEFPFEANGQSFVIVSNDQADGCVIIDAIQFLPADRAQTKTSQDAGQISDAATKALQKRRKQLAAEQKRLQQRLNERPKYLTVAESEPRDEIAIRIRGNVHQEGKSVRRGFLSAVGPAKEYADQIGSNGSGRVQLANWIVDPRHPLTARVYANRVWGWLMGEGIVATENNFGTTGEPPSHPELLDWLARELVANNWSTKHLVRRIVTSDAYRRSQAETPDMIAIDPDNRLYASAGLKRLPVEAIRDAMLTVSGELELSLGGSLIRSGTRSDYEYDHRSARRSVYWPVFRNSLPPLFEVFDFADASVSVGQRSRSTVAPQSLAMMNHPWVIDRARAASEYWLQNPSIGNSDDLIDAVYQACFGRVPDPREREICRRFLGIDIALDSHPHALPSADRLAQLIQSLFASIDFRYLH